MSCDRLDQLEKPFIAVRAERTKAAIDGIFSPELDVKFQEVVHSI